MNVAAMRTAAPIQARMQNLAQTSKFRDPKLMTAPTMATPIKTMPVSRSQSFHFIMFVLKLGAKIIKKWQTK
jgi:hypothetical protein